jgi:hypothetical protein
MVYPSAPQPDSTYDFWRVFSMPVGDKLVQAVAVPKSIANYFISLYTILIVSAVLSLWCTVFGIYLYRQLRKSRADPLSSSLWNKRYSLMDTFVELIQLQNIKWLQLWFLPAVASVLVFWLGQIFLSIYAPSGILIDHAAPARPVAVRVPDAASVLKASPGDRFEMAYQLHLLSVPAALRAAGSAQVASKEIRAKVSVTNQTIQSTPGTGNTIVQYLYGYNVTGAEMGLQHNPDLFLAVTGGCYTEYRWLLSQDNTSAIQTDTYLSFGNSSFPRFLIQSADSKSPGAVFQQHPLDPHWPFNMTWAAFVSSAYRLSFTEGTDPFYETIPYRVPVNGGFESTFLVKGGRPVLSCWESFEWSLNGQKLSDVRKLNSTGLPGLKIPPALLNILQQYFGVPTVLSIGTSLTSSALSSAKDSIAKIFDAGASSMQKDLERLVLAAYIATTNLLTDYTLMSNLTRGIENLATENGLPLDGVGDFVVWTPDVAAISLTYLILVPVLAVFLRVIVFLTLRYSRLQMVKALDAATLHRTICENLSSATPSAKGTWRIYT